MSIPHNSDFHHGLLGCLRDVSAHAEVCHNTLVDFTGEEAFEVADDLASGPAASRPAGDVVDRRLVEPPADDDRAMEGGAAREQTVIGEGVEGFSQVGWRIHDDLLQRDHRRGACFPGRIPRDLELPDLIGQGDPLVADGDQFAMSGLQVIGVRDLDIRRHEVLLGQLSVRCLWPG